MKTLATLGLALLALLATPRAAAQSRYNLGDTVANFTLTDRATGRPVQLTDFAGKVVLLEWFAWWCPYCQAAASQIGPGIVRYYADRGGNAAGLPVLHVSLNLQSAQETQTQQFVSAYQLGLVLNDFDRALANRFQSGGQPIFAVINGVDGSASHKQWELLYSQLGYGTTQAPITDLRRAIDTVRAPAVVAPPAPVVAPPVVTPPTVTPTTTPAIVPPMVAPPFSTPAVTPPVVTPPPTPVVTPPLMPVVTPPAVVVPAGPTSRLSNLSVLAALAPGETLTVGFTMQGGAKPLLLRAVGPALGALGVIDFLPDPQLALFQGPTQVAANDNWAGHAETRTAGSAVGAFPFATAASLDAALLSSVEGGRSLQVSGPGSGTVLVEAYDAAPGQTPRLVNLSVLHRLAGGGSLTAGFTLAGTGTKTVLLRAVGPGLAALGVPGTLGDPRLALFNSDQTKIAENDDWAAALAAAFAAVGAFPLGEGGRDAALLITLPPGGYSARVDPASSNTLPGTVLVEIYEVP